MCVFVRESKILRYGGMSMFHSVLVASLSHTLKGGGKHAQAAKRLSWGSNYERVHSVGVATATAKLLADQGGFRS